jgi:DNA-binding GntR family transcriptional regulator
MRSIPQGNEGGAGATGAETGSSPVLIKRTPGTLSLHALDCIRSAILQGQFKPGARITERELCSLARVSRTAVREALRRLEAQGLVEHTPNRGPVVSRITADELRQIFEVRLTLEGLAIQQFALRATKQELAALQTACDDIAATHEVRDISGFIAATDDFYDIILSGSGNGVIHAVVDSLRTRLTYIRIIALTQRRRGTETIDSTRRLLAALRTGDPRASRDALAQHLALVERRTLRALRTLEPDTETERR